ncbi:TonB-dependent receptor [Flavobacteriaceae bacterium S356]|uniref:TonB-dependent receptor n=1 Tax=Asprobacillus argus TaxID=3076534 RepID=A0ABU3LET8_9FLAO|nr:TonB-dependent receptor [Flavobacteriaceae bacterium S356]
MKLCNALKLLIVTLFLSFTTAKTTAQTGIIKGQITDSNGIYVPGANVVIESLKKGDITNFDGKFTIVSVPVGTHTIKVSYLGYEDITKEVVVKENETTTVSFELKSGSIELDVIQIKSSRLRGQAKALNTQKNNLNITNVVSTDQIGKFPDANIGDAVKRIPGITMQVDQGEARNIIVRGLSPQLNSVTLNGSRIPSAEGDNRNIQMDLIPSDMIQTIQVNKAVTPDMDADALGGSVNLITRTAPQGFRLSGTLGSGTNTITSKRILNGSFLVGDRTEDKKFGWMVGASINDNDFGSDNIEFEWDDNATPFINESDIRTYLVQRIRRSFSVNFDYQINDNNNIYLKTMYNWRDDRENRYRLRYRSIEYIDDTNPSLGYQGEIRRQTKGGIDNNRNKNRRLEDQRMQNYTLGGSHVSGKLEIDWLASYATASEERLNERYIEYELEEVGGNPIPFNIDLSDTRFPIITPVNTSDVALSNFSLREITEEAQFTEEKDMNFFVNLKLPMSLVNDQEGSFKFGARLRMKDKNRNNNFLEYSPLNNTFDNFASLPLVNETDPDFLAGSQYVAGQYVDPAYLGQLNLADAALFDSESIVDEFLGGNFDASENVIAGYAMITQKLSSSTTLLAGIRLENTNIEGTGNIVNYDVNGDFQSVTTITDKNSYTNILPSIHLKYDFSQNSSLRFAWTNTIARPNYIDLIPFRNIIREDSEIEIGNPDLDPTTSMNFDLLAETYFKNIGILSGGVFYKRINDFIYPLVTTTTDDSLGAGTTGFDAKRPVNGDDASIFGLEVALQKQLDFLPGFLKNFNIYLNYTHISSNANGIRNSDGDERNDVDLPNTAPNMFNGSLGYSDKRFSTRLSANFSDAYVDEIGGNSLEDRYYDKQFFLDFNASFTINKNLRVYADVNNITDQPLRYYQGLSNRTMQAEYYGRRISIGLKYDLFKRN